MSLDTSNEQELDDDFNSGFTNDEDLTETPERQLDEPKEKIETPEPEAPKLAQITELQFKDLLEKASQIDQIKAESRKAVDTAFGHIGGLKQRMDQMQASTPAGESIVATAADFAELQENFPEFTDAQIKGFNRVLSKIKGTGQSQQFDSSAIEKMVNERVAASEHKTRIETIDSVLDGVMENWVDEIRKPEFAAWQEKQSDAVKALAASDEIKDAKKMLRMYVASKNVQTATPQVKTVSTRQKQIEAAITPRGSAGHRPSATEDDDFESGFKSGNS